MLRELMESEFPNLSSRWDVSDYLDSLYKNDVPEMRHYVHIIKSLKKRPMFLNPKDLKFTEVRGSLIATEKGPLKRKFLIEIDRNAIAVYRQAKPRQRITDFEFYQAYQLDDLF